MGLISHKELKQLSDNRYIFHQKFPNIKNAESFFESIDNFLEIQEKFVTQTLKYAIQFFEAGKNFAKNKNFPIMGEIFIMRSSNNYNISLFCVLADPRETRRVDTFLSQLFPEKSRSYLQKMIEEGKISCN